MTHAPSFTDWLAERIGPHRWVVAPRLSPYLRSKGYDIALSPKRYAALEDEYNREQTAAKIFNVTLALFPAEADRMAADPDTWRNRIHAVREALAAESLI